MVPLINVVVSGEIKDSISFGFFENIDIDLKSLHAGIDLVTIDQHHSFSHRVIILLMIDDVQFSKAGYYKPAHIY